MSRQIGVLSRMADPDETNEMLTGADRDVLVDLLVNGDNSPSNIADNIGRHPKTVSSRLQELKSEGFVEPKGSGGVWRLTVKGLHSAQTISQHRS